MAAVATNDFLGTGRRKSSIARVRMGHNLSGLRMRAYSSSFDALSMNAATSGSMAIRWISCFIASFDNVVGSIEMFSCWTVTFSSSTDTRKTLPWDKACVVPAIVIDSELPA